MIEALEALLDLTAYRKGYRAALLADYGMCCCCSSSCCHELSE